MKKYSKKLVIVIMSMVLVMSSITNYAFASEVTGGTEGTTTETTPTPTPTETTPTPAVEVTVAEESTDSATTNVNVATQATIIDVTITPSIDIAINPNIRKHQAGAISASIINIANHSTAPVKVSSTGVVDAPNDWFQLVPKGTYNNWGDLNREQSKSLFLALRMDGGWKQQISGTWNSDNMTGQLVGTVANDCAANIMVDAEVMDYGTAYDNTKSSLFVINWFIELE